MSISRAARASRPASALVDEDWNGRRRGTKARIGEVFAHELLLGDTGEPFESIEYAFREHGEAVRGEDDEQPWNAVPPLSGAETRVEVCLAEARYVERRARQPCIVWGPPGAAKSQIAQQVAAAASRQYVDVRALLLDPVDLRGIPWRDGADRTRWAPPAFLPPSDDTGRWLINLEELPSALPMVQAALYQLVLDRKVGEYELPEGASLIACGNREADRGVVHRMPTPLASRSGAWARPGAQQGRCGDFRSNRSR